MHHRLVSNLLSPTSNYCLRGKAKWTDTHHVQILELEAAIMARSETEMEGTYWRDVERYGRDMERNGKTEINGEEMNTTNTRKGTAKEGNGNGEVMERKPGTVNFFTLEVAKLDVVRPRLALGISS